MGPMWARSGFIHFKLDTLRYIVTVGPRALLFSGCTILIRVLTTPEWRGARFRQIETGSIFFIL
jgi:hypothetical protein